MKSPNYIIICILLAAFILIGVFESNDLFTILSRLGFKTLLLLTFLKLKPIKISRKYLIFLSLIFFSDFLSLLAVYDDPYWGYGIIASFFVMYVILIVDSWKQFKLGRFNTVALSYCIVMAINAGLMILQLNCLHEFLQNSPILYGSQVVYHIMLWIISAVSVAYYLNSYSKKSMFFLIGSLLFVFADIFNGAYYFYGVDKLILPFSALLSTAGYIFFFNYFHTKECSLLTEAELLLEIEKNQEIKRPLQG